MQKIDIKQIFILLIPVLFLMACVAPSSTHPIQVSLEKEESPEKIFITGITKEQDQEEQDQENTKINFLKPPRKNPPDIIREVKSREMKDAEENPPEILEAEKVMKNRHDFENNTYTGHLITINFQNADIKSALRILADEGGYNLIIDPDIKGTVNLYISKPIPWDQAFDVILKTHRLEKMLEGTLIRICTQDNFLKEREMRKQAIITRRETEEERIKLRQLTTELIPVNYTTAESLLPVLKSMLSKSEGLAENPSIITDERTNTLIIKEQKEVIERMKEIIGELDRQTPQVMIEARIVTTSKAFGKQLGIQWGGRYSKPDTGYNFPHSIDIEGDNLDGYAVSLPPTGALGQIGVSLGHINNTSALDFQLSAMEKHGKGEVISNPRIATMDNEAASITSGIKLPYLTVDNEGQSNVTFQNASISLNVKPHITPNNYILLEIQAEKSSPDWGNAVAGQPAIAQNAVKTKYLVGNGETAVIGGLMEETDSLDSDQVPWFSHIPLVGLLFRNMKSSKDHNELLIFITPRTI
ncbi:MAG: type IV pilus secretin PilQ [bacterium]